jgi:hypothetical protein
MAVASSELATSFALYSRTPRIRRGPRTNICTTWIVGRIEIKISATEDDDS